MKEGQARSGTVDGGGPTSTRSQHGRRRGRGFTPPACSREDPRADGPPIGGRPDRRRSATRLPPRSARSPTVCALPAADWREVRPQALGPQIPQEYGKFPAGALDVATGRLKIPGLRHPCGEPPGKGPNVTEFTQANEALIRALWAWFRPRRRSPVHIPRIHARSTTALLLRGGPWDVDAYWQQQPAEALTGPIT